MVGEQNGFLVTGLSEPLEQADWQPRTGQDQAQVHVLFGGIQQRARRQPALQGMHRKRKPGGSRVRRAVWVWIQTMSGEALIVEEERAA